MHDKELTGNTRLLVSKCEWNEVKLLVKEIDVELFEIIERICVTVDINKFPLYKAQYPFGATIIQNGKLHFSTIYNESLVYNDPRVPHNISHDLQYSFLNEIPVALVLDKTSEFYVTVDNQPFPLHLISRGEFLGLESALNSTSLNMLEFALYNNNSKTLVSGARSTFMLPKVSDSLRHRNLKISYNLKQNRPQSFPEHWLVFKEIAEVEKSEWYSEFLFFSNSWLDKLKDPIWLPLANYFLTKRLTSVRSQSLQEWNMIFGYIEQKRNLRLDLNVLDMAKHFFSIAAGNALCFRPVVDNHSLPVQLIHSAYMYGYGLTEYCPIIMEPTYINQIKRDSGYYFQNYPTLPQFAFEVSGGRKKSIMTFIQEVQFVVNTYQSSLSDNSLIRNSLLNQLSRVVDFFYYHDDVGESKSIKDVDDFFKEDSRFLYNQVGDFPRNSQMLRGATKISFKN